MTLIVVPHGDLETRRIEVSYGRLKVLGVLAALAVVVFLGMAGSWWYVAARAARVPGLEAQVARLEAERVRIQDLAQTLSEVEARYRHVRELLGADAAPRGDGIWLPPLRRDTIPSAMGEGPASRPDSWPLTQAGYITRELTGDQQAEGHPGIDIAVPADSYIRAAGAGVVVEAGEDEIYGRYILIDHGGGYRSMYGHASRLFVDTGQRVAQGEVIALSGSTGRSTAPHLHFELRRNGDAIDPLTLVDQPGATTGP